MKRSWNKNIVAPFDNPGTEKSHLIFSKEKLQVTSARNLKLFLAVDIL
jgi:hypothetical protein